MNINAIEISKISDDSEIYVVSSIRHRDDENNDLIMLEVAIFYYLSDANNYIDKYSESSKNELLIVKGYDSLRCYLKEKEYEI